MNPVDFLQKRQSTHHIIAPGPNEDEIKQILQAGMTAPDHGGLVPWRFKVISGASNVQAFGALNIAHRQQSANPVPEKKREAFERWIERVPLIIAIGYEVDPIRKDIPETEQMQATCCAAMQILNAAFMLGYGAFWGTGMATHVDDFAKLLGFQPGRYLGYIAIGRLIAPLCPKKRASYQSVSHFWTPKEL